MEAAEVIILLGIGVIAGILGGLLGIGGSIVMIPALTLLLDRNIHLAQATAMAVNIVVAAPAIARHHRAGTVRWDVMRAMLPWGLVAIVAGVLATFLFEGAWLVRIFGVFLVWVTLVNIRRFIDGRREEADLVVPVAPARSAFTGTTTGFAAGLLGIGGGTWSVPLMQRICLLSLRQSIATSSALMIVTAMLGASVKLWKLPTVGATDGVVAPTVEEALLLAIILAPTAMAGSWVGAHLTHALPLRLVRLVFAVLIAVVAARMLLG